MSSLPSFLCGNLQFPLGGTLTTGCAMCVMPDRTLSCGGRQPPLSLSAIVSPLPTKTLKEIEGDGGMDNQEVVPPVPSQHQLELCLRHPKASACHLAGAGSGGIGPICNRSISLLHLMPPGNWVHFRLFQSVLHSMKATATGYILTIHQIIPSLLLHRGQFLSFLPWIHLILCICLIFLKEGRILCN